MGKIIVIEGTDCSGKSTQFEKLCKRLQNEANKFKTVSNKGANIELFFSTDDLLGNYLQF